MNGLYYTYSDYCREKYGEKVYKLPVNLDVTCPNRDGTLSWGGCTYCSDLGAGFEAQSASLSVSQQIKRNREYIGKKYHARLFAAYFQNFSNTYQSFWKLKERLLEALSENIVEVYVATRPDCVDEKIVELFAQLIELTGRPFFLEMGLQSVNHRTLKAVNRGHTLAEFVDACMMCAMRGVPVVTHVITDLPQDSDEDVVECAKVLSALRIAGVKMHSLYIPKGSQLETAYLNGKVTLLPEDAYIRRSADFLAYLKPDIVIHRLVGRIPEEYSVHANFGKSWWLLRERIEGELKRRGQRQGSCCDYLNGAALQKKDFKNPSE